MTFKEAFEAMKHGAKVKLPSWAGYWYWSKEKQTIIIHTKDGEELDIRETKIPDYTFGNICSDESVMAAGEFFGKLCGSTTMKHARSIILGE